MRSEIKLIGIAIVLLLAACHKVIDDGYNQPGVEKISANPLLINADSFEKVVPVAAIRPRNNPVGSPKKITVNSNKVRAGIPEKVLARVCRALSPGYDTVPKAQTVAAKGIIKLAGRPEVVLARPMVSRDESSANFSFYKTLQGLKANHIRGLIQDRKGNIWLANFGGGVCRYDGQFFTIYMQKDGLANNTVTCLLEDKHGNLWFGTNGGGVSCFDGKNFTNYNKESGLADNFVYCMLEDRLGRIWLGTFGGGLSCFDGKYFVNYTMKEGLPGNHIISIGEDNAGNLWFGTYRGGVAMYDGNRVELSKRKGQQVQNTQNDFRKVNGEAVKTFHHFNIREGLANNSVCCFLQSKTGDLWFGTNGEGVSRYDGTNFYNYTEKEGLSNNFVTSIFENDDSTLWFGTTGGGLSCFDGNVFSKYDEKSGLSNDFIWNITKDRSGNIWIATEGGLSLYKGSLFNFFGAKLGNPVSLVNCMMQDSQGMIWFGTDAGGICVYDGKTVMNFTDQDGFPYPDVFAILEDEQRNIWFGTSGGLVCYHRYPTDTIQGIKLVRDSLKDRKTKAFAESFYVFTDKHGLPGNFVYSLCEDHSGKLWVGTNLGVSCFDGKTFTNITEKNGLSNNTVLSLMEDHNKGLWIGTYTGGLNYYKDKKLGYYSTKEGFSGNLVTSMLQEKNGVIWFGTSNGAVRYDGKYFNNFGEKDGLISKAVNNLIFDTEGNLWMGTIKGISKITNEKLSKLNCPETDLSRFNPISEALFINYGYEEGFKGITCRRNAVMLDKQHKIWWGTDLLTRYNNEGDVTDTTTPVINITNIKLLNEELDWARMGAVRTDSSGVEHVTGNIKDTLLANGILLQDIEFDGISSWFGLPQNLRLPYNINDISFSFVGLHMQSPRQLKYRYMLEGKDLTWSSVTPRSDVSYGNLPAGNYEFKVKAMNQNGDWSEPATFSFCVLPPWWKTWWFKAFIAVIVLSSVVFGIRWREKRIKNIKNRQIRLATDMLEVQERERRRIAADLHDRLGSMLATVKLYFNTVEENIEQLKKDNQGYYAKASNLLDEACEEVRKISHDLASGALFKLGLIAALNDLKHTITKTNQLKMDVLVNGLRDRLPAEVEVNIYRIIQEILNNTLKHAKATKLTVKIDKNEENLCVFVTDDGIGFDAVLVEGKEGIGLKNIRNRVSKLNGKINIESGEKGTEINFSIPLIVS